MDFFEKIEEIENKMSELIADRVSMFSKITEDFDLFLKTEKEKEKELNIDHKLKEMLTEIKSSKTLTSTIIHHGKFLKSMIKQKKAAHGNKQESPKKNFPKRSLSDFNLHRNSFNIFNTEFLNYFDQTNFRNQNKYYSKHNEIGIIRSKIVDIIQKKLRTEFYGVIIEKNNNIGISRKFDKKDSVMLKRIGNSTSRSNSIERSTEYIPLWEESDKINKNKGIQATNNPNSFRLYPQPKKKEEILTTRFVLNKMFEFRFNGDLNKKCDIEEAVKEFKLGNRKIDFKMDIRDNIDLTEKLIENYKFKKNTNSNLNTNCTDKNEGVSNVKNKNELFVKTNSNYYLKINRNKLNLNIDLRKKNEKEVEQLEKKVKFDKNFYKNVPNKKFEDSNPLKAVNLVKQNYSKKQGKLVTPHFNERVISARIKIKNI